VQRRFAEVPHRQEDAEGEDEHEHAEGDDHDRLDIGAQVLDLVFDFALVQAGDFKHQPVHVTRFFAHRYHLQHGGVEHAGCIGGTQDAFAALDAVAHLFDLAAHVFVIHHHAHGVEGLHDGNAALE